MGFSRPLEISFRIDDIRLNVRDCQRFGNMLLCGGEDASSGYDRYYVKDIRSGENMLVGTHSAMRFLDYER